MHEVSICQGIIETLKAEIPEDQYKNIREVHLKVGVLSCVEPKILEHVFRYIVEDTPFQNSCLHTELVAIESECNYCKRTFRVENYRFVCPICERPSAKIVEGNELTIYKIISEEPAYAEINE
jgi:hydrogenase nickel incorporation protein HypA/HybF